MPPKKDYPRNAVLSIGLTDYERDAIAQRAAEVGKSISDLGHEMLLNGSLRALVARFYPQHSPKITSDPGGNSEAQR
jgi:hypothetical protein